MKLVRVAEGSEGATSKTGSSATVKPCRKVLDTSCKKTVKFSLTNSSVAIANFHRSTSACSSMLITLKCRTHVFRAARLYLAS